MFLETVRDWDIRSSIAGYNRIAPVDSERDSGEYMCCDWKGDKEGFEGKRLVVWTGEEEVVFRHGDRACDEGDDGGIGYVK